MNESLSVRPRMYASGATSITPRSMRRATRLGVEHVVQRVVERAQVRVDLREHVAGQEAEPLPRLDRGTGEDDAVHGLRLERLHRERDREVALAGARGTDRERDRVVAHRVDVALLARGLRPHALAAAHDLGEQHVARPHVRLDHADGAVDAVAVERMALLHEHDELLEQAPDPARRRRGSPVTVISLPRTRMFTGNAASIRRSRSSCSPSRSTMRWLPGTSTLTVVDVGSVTTGRG